MQPDAFALFHPFSPGVGIVERFTIPTPAAGTNFSLQLGSGYVTRIRSLFFSYSADANVANRVIAVEYRDADLNCFAGSAAGVFQAATSIFRWYAGIGQGLNVVTQSTRQTMSLPDVFLLPGETVQSLIASIQAGDQISGIRGVWERFPETAGAYLIGEAQDRRPEPPRAPTRT